MTNIGIRRRDMARSICVAMRQAFRLRQSRQAVTNAGALVGKGSEGHRNVAR
jgi:hypothetical protein